MGLCRYLFGSSKPAQAKQEDIKEITNSLGKVKGNANGIINFGEASSDGKGFGQRTEGNANYDQQTKAVNDMAEAVAKLDGGNNAPATGRKVRGLTNLTKDVKGNANGAINFGSLAWK